MASGGVDWEAWYARAAQRSARFGDGRRGSARGVPYGPHPRQVVNLHLPAAGPSPRSLVAFVHGGGLRSGHPDCYDFLAAPYVAAGVAFATVGYRLRAPEVPPSACLEDVALGVALALARLAGPDGRRPRLALAGHSAGAAMVAMLALGPHPAGAAGAPVPPADAVALVSGAYEAHCVPDAIALLGARGANGEPGPADLARVPARLLIAASGNEPNRPGDPPDLFAEQARRLAEALARAGAPAPRLVRLQGDHTQTAEALGEPPLAEALLAALAPPPA